MNQAADTLSPQEQVAFAYYRLKMLARQVLHNEHFEQIVMAASANIRRQIYNEIKPYLRFKPKPFCLMKARKAR